jgi:hypothetical protein
VPGHIQYIPRTTYYTLLRLIGPDPRWFFALMLGTHLANVGLLYAVGYALTGFPALACLGAALWGSLRINEGTLGWYTVIGQAFATLLILIVLHGLSRAERRGTLSTREASGWFALLLLSCVSFGTAMPVAALFPFVAWTVLPPGTASRGARRVLWSLSLAVPVAYVIAYALYLRAYGHDDKYAKFFLGYVFSRSYWVRVSAGTLQLLRAGLTSLIANAPGTGPAFIPNRAFQPSIGDPFELGGWAGFFSIFAPDGTGRRVFFVETRPEVRARAAPGSPMAPSSSHRPDIPYGRAAGR